LQSPRACHSGHLDACHCHPHRTRSRWADAHHHERKRVILDYPLRRHHARITFSEPVAGAMTASHDVHILDLSLGGARVEHTIILRPGSSCYLRMPLNDQVVTVNCRVIWSRAVERGPGETGGTALIFHSGVQFGALPREAQALLEAYLAVQGG
jgi:PilZ domain